MQTNNATDFYRTNFRLFSSFLAICLLKYVDCTFSKLLENKFHLFWNFIKRKQMYTILIVVTNYLLEPMYVSVP